MRPIYLHFFSEALFTWGVQYHSLCRATLTRMGTHRCWVHPCAKVLFMSIWTQSPFPNMTIHAGVCPQTPAVCIWGPAPAPTQMSYWDTATLSLQPVCLHRTSCTGMHATPGHPQAGKQGPAQLYCIVLYAQFVKVQF